MKTWVHIIFSMVVAAILYQIFGWKAGFILVSGVLIDADHYLWFVVKRKNFNLFECYRFIAIESDKIKYKNFAGEVMVFHTIEFLLLMVLLSFFNEIALIFTIGLAGHYLLDIIWYIFGMKGFILNHSLLWWLYRNKIQKF